MYLRGGYSLTVETSVVGLNESLLDLAVLNKEHVALAAVVPEDGAAVEAKVEGLGKLAGGVAQEANLITQNMLAIVNIYIVGNTYTALALGIQGISPSLGPV